MTKIAVLDDWQNVAADLADWSSLKTQAEVTVFRDPLGDADAVVAALADFDIILAMRERTALLKPVIARLPKLKLISFTGPRNSSVDHEAAGAAGITVCNTLNARPSHATAEIALSLLMAAARKIPLGDAEIRAGRFQQNVKPGIELFGRTMGIVGLGKIGARMASYGQALGMKVVAWSTNLTEEQCAEVGVTRVTKDELMATADAISLHLVLSPRSRGIIGAADIARMKPGSILINTSRGPLIDQPALLAALHEGRIVAGLDVYETEPLPPGDPIVMAPNTVLSPHLGYCTQENLGDFYRYAVENIEKFLAGTPVRVINAEALAAAKA